MSLPAEPAAGGTSQTAIIGVSLKMYFGYERTIQWCREVADIVVNHRAVQSRAIELFVLPAHPVLPEAVRILEEAGATAGAQDIFWEDEGAFTGEVSGKMVSEVGGRYAEVGHAERRSIFGEDDDVIGLKTEAAYRNGLTPILCVGEPLRGTAADAIRHCTREIQAVLNRAGSRGYSGRAIVAYEPQWAIGAAKPATPTFISEVITGLDRYLQTREGHEESRVIYGGSAGPGLISQLAPTVAGLFLGRFAHRPAALLDILNETADRLGLDTTTEVSV